MEKPDMNALLASPEVQKAIQEAAANAAATAVAAMAKNGASLSHDEATRKLFSDMALSIADLAHQGSARPRPVAPEAMAARAEAARKMDELLAQVAANLRKASESGDKDLLRDWLPQYRVISKVYFNERLVEPYRRPERRGDRPVPEVIAWSGPPNDALEPINDIAKRLKQLFRESVGTMSRLDPRPGPNGSKVTQDNRGYVMTVGGNFVKSSAPGGIPLADLLASEAPVTAPEPEEFVHVLGTVHPATPQKAGEAAALAQAR